MKKDLHKPDMESRVEKLKDELYDRCERLELTFEEYRGADEYLNKVSDVLNEFSY